MGWWTTTKQLLLRQDAESSHTKSQAKDNLGSSWSAWIFTWSRNALLWCQNVYISTTASDRIVDTLELFPHNYQMPQLSSTDWLLMGAKDMTDAFQNPHPEVHFASVGDDTVNALADLAAIFKLKLQHAQSHVTHASPATIIQRPNIIPFPTQISTSTMPDKRQTRSQATIHTPDIPDGPLPPRVVTPRTLHHSPPRVPARFRQLSPRNLSQYDFFN
jgi:hypothetical protein